MTVLRIICISDTHNKHSELILPKGDILLHAGDATGNGTLSEVNKFAVWFGQQDYSYKIFCAGNHDFLFENYPTMGKTLAKDNGYIYLEDDSIIIEDIKFYGSPYTPRFFDWAFNMDRGEKLKHKWSLIPEDTRVLITHGPPYSILDKTVDSYQRLGQCVGCEELLKRTGKLKDLLLHTFGHIHCGYGVDSRNGVYYANASICNEQYRVVNTPFIFDINTDTKQIKQIKDGF